MVCHQGGSLSIKSQCCLKTAIVCSHHQAKVGCFGCCLPTEVTRFNGVKPLLAFITQDDVDDAADGEEDDADVDGEGRHRLIAQLHVLPTEAVDRVGHGLPVAQVLLVRILQLHPHLSQAAALRLLRERPVVEAPPVLVDQHVVGLPQLNELLRGSLERERRRVGMRRYLA